MNQTVEDPYNLRGNAETSEGTATAIEGVEDPYGLNNGSYLEPIEPEEVTEESMLASEQFRSDAMLLFQKGYITGPSTRNDSVDYLKSFQGIPTVGEPVVGLDEMMSEMERLNVAETERGPDVDSVAREAIDEIGRIRWNLVRTGMLAFDIGDWSDEEQQAMIRSMAMYEKLPTSMKTVGRAVEGVATDMTTYAGFGFVANALSKIPMKAGAAEMLKQLAKQSTTKTAVGVASAEGFAYGAADSEFQQAIQNEGDFSQNDRVQTLATGALTAVGAGSVTWGLSKFLGRNSKSNNATDEVTDEVLPEAVPEVPSETGDVWYHGTDSDIKEWKPSTSGRNKDTGVWVTSSPELGSKYAERHSSGQAVYPLRTGASANSIQLQYGGTYRHYAIPEEAVLTFPDGSTKTLAEAMPLTKKQKELGVSTSEVARFFKESGEFDGINFKDILDNADKTDITSDVMAVFNPEKLEGAFSGPPRIVDELADEVPEVQDLSHTDILDDAGEFPYNPPKNYDETKPAVNTERFETTDDVKDFIEERAKYYKERRFVLDDGNPEGVRTLAAARADADKTVEKLRNDTGFDARSFIDEVKDDVQKLADVENRMIAMGDITATLADEIVALTKRQMEKNITPIEQAELLSKAAMLDEVGGLNSLISAGSSRLLGGRRITVKPIAGLLSDVDLDQGAKAAQAIADRVSKVLVDGKMPTVKVLRSAVNRKKIRKVMDEFNKVRSTSMLSALSTLLAASISNYSNLLGTPLVELLGHPLPTKADSLMRKRALATYSGYRMFLGDSIKEAYKALRSGEHKIDPYVKREETSLAPAASSEKRSIFKKAYSTLHYPHHVLRFLDEQVKFLRSKSLAYADGVVMASKQGLKEGSPEFKKVVEDHIASSFDKNGRLLNKEYLGDVRRMTYTNEQSGVFAKTVGNIADSGAGFGRLIAFPFPRTPFAIVNHGLEFVPTGGLGFLNKQQADIIRNRKENPMEFRKLQARKIIGLAGASVFWMAADADNMTGSGPRDHNVRKLWLADHEPYSFRLSNGKWVSYAKYEPFATLMGIVADVNYGYRKDMTKYGEDDVSEYMNIAMHALVNNLLSKSYFDSFEEILNVFNEEDGATTYGEAWLTSFSPNILRQNNTDEYQRAAYTTMDKLFRGLPGFSEELPQKYDYLGRALETADYRWSPFRVVTKDSSFVDDEIARLSTSQDSAGSFREPDKTLGIPQADFKKMKDEDTGDSIYAMYMEMLAEQTDMYGTNLHEALANEISSPDYNSLGDPLYHDIKSPKAKRLSRVIQRYRMQAKERLMAESYTFREVVSDFRARKEETANQ